MSGAISIGAVALAVGTGFATGFTTFAVVGILGATLGAIGTIAKIKELQYAGMALGAVGAIGGVAASMGAFASEAATATAAGAENLAGAAASDSMTGWAGTAAGTTNYVGTGAAGTGAEIANASAQAATGSAGAVQGAAEVAAPAAASTTAEIAAPAVNVAEFGGPGGYDAINMVNGFDPSSAAYASLDPSAASVVSAPDTIVAGTTTPDSLLNVQNAATPPEVTTADFTGSVPTGTEGTGTTQLAGTSGADTLAGGTGTDTLGGMPGEGGAVPGETQWTAADGSVTEMGKAPAGSTASPTPGQPASPAPGQPAPASPAAGSDTAVTGTAKTTFGTTSNTATGEFAKGPLVGSDTAATGTRDVFDKIGDWAQKNQMLTYGGLQIVSGLGKAFFSSDGKAPPSAEELEALRAQAARNYAAEALDRQQTAIAEKRAYNMSDRAPTAVWGTPPWITQPNPLPTAELTPAQAAARAPIVPTGLINSPGSKVTGSVTV